MFAKVVTSLPQRVVFVEEVCSSVVARHVFNF